MSLSFHEYLDSIGIPYEKIKSATNNFAIENLIPQDSDSSVKLYKGQLLLSGQLIDVVAYKFQRLDRAIKEMAMSYLLHQKNLSSVVGLSGDLDDPDDELVMVKKHMVNGSLDKHLCGSTVTWLQRLQICVGVSQALSCLHYNDVLTHDHYMVHGDIKSSKILLDDDWLQGSQFSVVPIRHQLHITSEHKATLQYIDPAYETTGGLNYKSDVFSFGVVLFEVLFGTKAEILNDDVWYFARLARLHFEERRLDEMIDHNIRKQMDLQSLKLFSETAYFCLKEERSQRPDMNQILKRLKRALEYQKKYQSPEQSTVAVEGSSSNHLKIMLPGKNLDHLRIALSDIKLATENFSETYCIGSGGYGKVYKANLSSVIKGKKEDDFSTSGNNVAIKRIFSRTDKQGEQGFLAEVEMLSKCKHPNIISLLGFCDEDSEMILVYEYASKGSLDDYFGNDDNIINLTWAQRIQICLNIAHGLKYLHTSTMDKQKIIHRDIKSANILLDDNLVAKIADFGLSKLFDVNQRGSTHITCHIAGTEVYLDPEYLNTGKLKKASDIYSFGVVMFEIFCGKLAYVKLYGDKGLPSMVRECFNEGTLKEMFDPKLKEVDFLNRWSHQHSLDTFSKFAYQCLVETQAQRPTIEVIVKELEKAFDFQTTLKNNLQKSLAEIKLATRNFNDYNCIGEGMFWKLYEEDVRHDNSNRCTTIVAKRWDSKSPQGRHQFLKELEILSTLKHKNIIDFVGYCCEEDERIIVYEHLSNGRLDKHLDDPSLTWIRRLNICIDVASGLAFFHEHEADDLIHRGIKSSSILLNGEWKAKLSNFELSSLSWACEEIQHVFDNAYGLLEYVDPNYEQGFLERESDIYSLGVVLMEIMCGRLARTDGYEDNSQSIVRLAKRRHNEGKIDELVFEGIRDHIAPESLTTYLKISLQCLEKHPFNRPSASDVVEALKIALELQEDHEVWEPKLPIEYKEIVQMSKSPGIYTNKNKRELYNMLNKGILLHEGKMWFSVGTKGERYEMISLKFSLKSRKSYKWVSILSSSRDMNNLRYRRRPNKSHQLMVKKHQRYPKVIKWVKRFEEVIELPTQQVLHIKCKIEGQMLSPSTQYACYLVFKFSENCRGLHSPVILRDLLCWNNKHTEVLYFRSPSPINRHSFDWIPENREDGCMEVCVWKGNSNGKFKNSCLPLNLKLISYEGNMSGLILFGLEFRPI